MSITPQTSNTPVNLNGVAFPDTCHGWAEGAIDKADGTRVGAIVATSDGGATFSRQAEEAVNFADDFRGVAFPDTQHGWAVGGASPDPGGGLIIATSNGGETWERQTTPVTNADKGITDLLFGIAFADINHGLAVGVTTTGGGVILATADGGDTWTPQANPGQMLFGVAFPDISHGWLVGEGGTILAVLLPSSSCI